MIESIDWPSFGYGAGVLAVSTYAWSARGSMVRARERLVDWLDRRAFARASTEAKLKQLAVRLETLDDRVHELQKQSMRLAAARVVEREQYQQQVLGLVKALERKMAQDAAWENYQRRKKGLAPLPVGRGAASPAAVMPSGALPVVTRCECGHWVGEHGSQAGGVCNSCDCWLFKAWT